MREEKTGSTQLKVKQLAEGWYWQFYNLFDWGTYNF